MPHFQFARLGIAPRNRYPQVYGQANKKHSSSQSQLLGHSFYLRACQKMCAAMDAERPETKGSCVRVLRVAMMLVLLAADHRSHPTKTSVCEVLRCLCSLCGKGTSFDFTPCFVRDAYCTPKSISMETHKTRANASRRQRNAKASNRTPTGLRGPPMHLHPVVCAVAQRHTVSSFRRACGMLRTREDATCGVQLNWPMTC